MAGCKHRSHTYFGSSRQTTNARSFAVVDQHFRGAPIHRYARCVCMAGPRCWSSVRVNIQRRQKYSVSSHNSSFLSDSLIWCVLLISLCVCYFPFFSPLIILNRAWGNDRGSYVFLPSPEAERFCGHTFALDYAVAINHTRVLRSTVNACDNVKHHTQMELAEQCKLLSSVDQF